VSQTLCLSEGTCVRALSRCVLHFLLFLLSQLTAFACSVMNTVRNSVKSFRFLCPDRLRPTQPAVHWVPGIKRPGREAEHSPPFSANVKNAWSYISTPPYVYMASLSDKYIHISSDLIFESLKCFEIYVQCSYVRSIVTCYRPRQSWRTKVTSSGNQVFLHKIVTGRYKRCSELTANCALRNEIWNKKQVLWRVQEMCSPRHDRMRP
jgi:hypothetical protein